jgi:hypothetical protein
MKKFFTVLGIASLIFANQTFAQADSSVNQETFSVISEKIYDDNTRICYFSIYQPLSTEQKVWLESEAENNPNIMQLSFFDDNVIMFKSAIGFTADSVVNFINAEAVKISGGRRNAPSAACDNVIVMNCGQTYSGTLRTTGGSYRNYPGCTYNEPGEERIYSFTPERTARYTFTGGVTSGDPDFFLMNTCDNTGANMLGGCWSSGNKEITLIQGTTYYVIVDNAKTTMSSGYTLKVECPQPNENCMSAEAGCATSSVQFQARQNVPSLGHIGCLYTTPNPSWFWMRVSEPGDINIHIASGADVDFIAWGPFTSIEEGCSDINLTSCSCPNNTSSPGFYPYAPDMIVDCSYSAAITENLHILNAQIGQVYILLLTNYANANTGISFIQNSGSGATDCDILTPIQTNSPLCIGDTLRMSTHAITGATYYWTKEGDDAFYSLEQNVVINNVTTADAGQYTLCVTVDGQMGSPILTTVVVNEPSDTTYLEASVCVGGKYMFAGEYRTGAGVYYDNLTNRVGCDSVVVLTLIETDCKVNIGAMQEICADEESFVINYTTIGGTLSCYSANFAQSELDAGFNNIVCQTPGSENGGIVQIVIPSVVRPDIYSVELVFDYTDESQIKKDVKFTILYSDTIIYQKWNDVLAIQNENYNGGHFFSAYEWYRNETKIENENHSYIYLGEGNTFNLSDKYRARLTRTSDNVPLFTCAYTPKHKIDITSLPTIVPRGNRMPMRANGNGKVAFITISGIKTSEQTFAAGDNYIRTPETQGFYIIIVEETDQIPRKQILLVK